MRTEVNNLKYALEKHGLIACHGEVCERLTEHDTRLDSQYRSLDTIRSSNDRLARDLYQFNTDLKVLEQRVDIETDNVGIDP